MKLLFDMNLSPLLAQQMKEKGWESIHWTSVGDPCAPDRLIMDWARKNDYFVITNDLDFGDILAATNAESPSVIQFRMQNLSPDHLRPFLLKILPQYRDYLNRGALITVNEKRARVKILPFR